MKFNHLKKKQKQKRQLKATDLLFEGKRRNKQIKVPHSLVILCLVVIFLKKLCFVVTLIFDFGLFLCNFNKNIYLLISRDTLKYNILYL